MLVSAGTFAFEDAIKWLAIDSQSIQGLKSRLNQNNKVPVTVKQLLPGYEAEQPTLLPQQYLD